MKVDNKKEVFEKEGRLFDHIKAMYINSQGYQHYWQNRRKERIVRQLKELKNECNSMLDIGCAEGLFVEMAKGLGYFAIGCDLSRSKLSRANVGVVESDAQILPFKDNSFDIVMLNRILELIPDDEKALAEASRVARKYLVITAPNKPNSLIAKLKRNQQKKEEKIMTYKWGLKARMYNLVELKTIIERYGYVHNLTTIAPFGHIMPLCFGQRIPASVHRILDNILEGKWFLREYGHDIFALVKVKNGGS
jgi:ubiquinone/menaquinone biosynthesis C-methylase UbiE